MPSFLDNMELVTVLMARGGDKIHRQWIENALSNGVTAVGASGSQTGLQRHRAIHHVAVAAQWHADCIVTRYVQRDGLPDYIADTLQLPTSRWLFMGAKALAPAPDSA